MDPDLRHQGDPLVDCLQCLDRHHVACASAHAGREPDQLLLACIGSCRLGHCWLAIACCRCTGCCRAPRGRPYSSHGCASGCLHAAHADCSEHGDRDGSPVNSLTMFLRRSIIFTAPEGCNTSTTSPAAAGSLCHNPTALKGAVQHSSPFQLRAEDSHTPVQALSWTHRLTAPAPHPGIWGGGGGMPVCSQPSWSTGGSFACIAQRGHPRAQHALHATACCMHSHAARQLLPWHNQSRGILPAAEAQLLGCRVQGHTRQALQQACTVQAEHSAASADEQGAAVAYLEAKLPPWGAPGGVITHLIYGLHTGITVTPGKLSLQCAGLWRAACCTAGCGTPRGAKQLLGKESPPILSDPAGHQDFGKGCGSGQLPRFGRCCGCSKEPPWR